MNLTDLIKEKMKADALVCLDKGSIAITIGVELKYRIPIDECYSSETLVDWIDHICVRPWCTPQILRRFITLAREQSIPHT